MNRLSRFKLFVISAFVLTAAVLFCLYFFFDISILSAVGVYIFFAIIYVVTFLILSKNVKEDYKQIERNVSSLTKISMEEGNIGLVMYDSNFKITYMNKQLRDILQDHVGEKVLNWLPDLQDVVTEITNQQLIIINDEKYIVSKDKKNNTLIFRDISREYDLSKKLEDRAYVFGLLNYDNYSETNENEDTVSFVNANIKLVVMDYFRKYGVIYKTLRNNRMQLILNKEIFNSLLKDRFSILNTIRKEAKKSDLDITLSIAFTMGRDDIVELDNECQNLLDLVQTRGGDQVVVKEKDREPVFYGGASEAKERQSRVKVRVMANTIKSLVKEASNVIIVGHQMADSDCIGSMLGMSCICRPLNADTAVVTKSGEIEPMTKDILRRFGDELGKEHNFVSENEALNRINDDTLVIMCDHHSLGQSNCQTLLKQAKRVLIVDHHRRSVDLDVNAILLYIEASASSTCELVSEFLSYFPKAKLSESSANMMYAGILIDTNHFRVRTGTATFDAAKILKKAGANIELVETLVQEPYEMVKKRTEIIASAMRFEDNILMSVMREGEYPRSIASQASDTLIQTKDIEAAFVLCYTAKDEVMISARSKGDMNVQLIMEKMNGGGHKTAAGLQRKDSDIDSLKKELETVLRDYLSERKKENEGNTVE